MTGIPPSEAAMGPSANRATIALLTGLYLVGHEVAFLFPETAQGLMAVWPAGGVGLAMLLLSPRRQWPMIVSVLFAIGFAADLIAGRLVLISAGFTAANMMETVVGGLTIVWACGEGVRFTRVKEVVALMVAATIVNAGTTCFGAAVASVSMSIPFWPSWQMWWIADALGMLLVTPLLITWADWNLWRLTMRAGRAVEAVAFSTIWCMAVFLTFSNYHLWQYLSPQPYMLFALVTWAALRFGMRGVTAAMAALTVLAIQSDAVVHGPLILGGETSIERLLMLQIYLGFAAVIGYLLAASYAERRAAEQASREGQLRMRLLEDNLPNGVVYQIAREVDGTVRFVYISGGFEKLNGFKAEDALRNPDIRYEAVVEEDRALIAAAEEASARDLSLFSVVVRLQPPDGGRLRWVQICAAPRRLDDGRILWDGIELDITNIKEAEQTIREREQELSAIYHHLPIAFFLVDGERRILKINDHALDMTGGDETRVLGGFLGEALGCAHRSASRRGCETCPFNIIMQDTFETGREHHLVEFDMTHVRDGAREDRIYLLSTDNLTKGEQPLVLVSMLDITEHRNAQQRLDESRSLLRAVIESTDDFIFSVDSETFSMTSFNTAMADYYWNELQIPIQIGRRLEDQFEDEQYIRKWREYFETTLREGHFTTEYELNHHGRTLLMNMNVLRRNGAVFGVAVFGKDITERKRAEEERRRLEAQLVQSQKIESIGRLAGGIAHDLNNMLAPIMGYGGMLIEHTDRCDPRHHHASEIVKAAESARDLVRQLLAFARKQTIEMKPLDLNRVIGEFQTLLRRTIRENVAIEIQFVPEPATIMGDAGQIDQIILNLAVNAQDAMPDGGKLEIRTGRVELDAGNAAELGNLPAGDYVTLSVSDTGIGMDAGTRAMVFEPFFTTKGPGKGMGMGLATVYGIVRQHGGDIRVTSEPGAGSTFQVYFPRTATPAEVKPQKAGRDGSHGSETILVVEDQVQVRTLVAEILSEHGYNVLLAQSGEDALAVAGRHPSTIHLLLTDIIMTGMDGRQLHRRLGAARPGMKVLYMSGYSADVISEEGILDDGVNFIEKPFTPNALAEKAREALDT